MRLTGSLRPCWRVAGDGGLHRATTRPWRRRTRCPILIARWKTGQAAGRAHLGLDRRQLIPTRTAPASGWASAAALRAAAPWASYWHGRAVRLRGLEPRSDPEVRRVRQAGEVLRRGHVHLPARHPRRPRRQCLGHRRPRQASGKGHQVFKFSPDGKVLMTLGKPGVAGAGNDEFNAPSAVVVAPNGDIFVADGHGGNTNARIVKFAKNGKFIKTWGKKGTGPGEFDGPHALAMDSQGRLFVGDREQQPHPDLRPGWQVPRRSGRSSAGRAASSSTRTT